MINNDRIVPIQKVDFLTMVGIILKLSGQSFNVLKSTDVLGNFSVESDGVTSVADQPVVSLDFASGVTDAEVYFVPDFAFKGITVAGAAATISDDGIALADIQPDGITLYEADLASGEVTITAVSPTVE